MVHDEWYYCLAHHGIERYEGCRSVDRLGPYQTRAEAEQALERAQARNEEWDSDPRFNDPDEDDADADDYGTSGFDTLRP
ncbi:MAG: hypothetical protein IPL36_04915 [Nigerium sp.]|nr:hypothetical protein [Nigerium sp.]